MKNALVMGGTRGLGLELAKAGATRGYSVLATGRSAGGFMPIIDSVKFGKQDFTDPASPLGSVSRSLEENPPNIVFWVGGIFMKQNLRQCMPGDIETLVTTHLTGPITAVSGIHASKVLAKQPYHLVVIASTSSYRIREEETVYCAAKAAKAAFARNFSRELARELPGSKTTLVNPGAMNTGFFLGTEYHGTRNMLMDPARVAGIIWEHVIGQTGPYLELNIENGQDNPSVPAVSLGPKEPERPF